MSIEYNAFIYWKKKFLICTMNAKECKLVVYYFLGTY